MIIRAAHAGDAPAICAIWNPFILSGFVTFNAAPHDPETIRALLAARSAVGHGFLVAEGPQGGVLGFATYGPFRRGVGYAHAVEHTVMLAPGNSGRGVGRTLMTQLEVHARAGGQHVMMAGISACNAPGLAFHDALGYRRVGYLPEVGFKHGQWLDLVLMHKLLQTRE